PHYVRPFPRRRLVMRSTMASGVPANASGRAACARGSLSARTANVPTESDRLRAAPVILWGMDCVRRPGRRGFSATAARRLGVSPLLLAGLFPGGGLLPGSAPSIPLPALPCFAEMALSSPAPAVTVAPDGATTAPSPAPAPPSDQARSKAVWIVSPRPGEI